MEVHAFNSACLFFFLKERTTFSKSLAEFPLTILLLFMELLNVKLADVIKLEGCIVSICLFTYIKHAYNSLHFSPIIICAVGCNKLTLTQEQTELTVSKCPD